MAAGRYRSTLIERIESCGLIIPVGYWVMEEACRQLAAWQSQGIMLPLSVNVSLLQLLEHDRGEEMLKLIARYRIAPGTLILEVTESCRMDDPQDVMARLRPLREAGVQIALDDFGMGYAGLHQLQQMKALVDILKIDKVFIDMLPEDVSMVPAMIQLARGLSLRIVAEGVENDAQRRWLQAAACRGAPGPSVRLRFAAGGIQRALSLLGPGGCKFVNVLLTCASQLKDFNNCVALSALVISEMFPGCYF